MKNEAKVKNKKSEEKKKVKKVKRKGKESPQQRVNECAVERGEVGRQGVRAERKPDKGKEVQAARVKNFAIDFGDQREK